MNWRKRWFNHVDKHKFASKEEYARRWRSANTWYRLTGIFMIFSGWTEKIMAFIHKWVRKYTERR